VYTLLTRLFFYFFLSTIVLHRYSSMTAASIEHYHSARFQLPPTPNTRVAEMMSLVSARKRKEAHNPTQLSRDKGKVRVIERSAEGHSSGSTKNLHGRNSTPASRTFTTLRRGSIKIFSIFRNGKGV
jgi:hypothetical protein